ncbi:protein shisa-4 [Corvus kubaryi]|uniref:protein shisa-4 n=1 Tax=Corvus kubaryi TaxID=68294 RepID=UPI001C05131A|nr:protein shisa-4 [Corvus kubaryi]
MGPGGAGSGWPLAGTLLVAVAASMVAGGEDCLWYVDRNGSWHPGFDCEFFTFCCGTCHQRYCCRDPLRLLTERQQRHCLAFSPKTIAGIASAVVLFIAVVTTIVCCFMCSCCYLYQRRRHPPTPLQGAGLGAGTGVQEKGVQEGPRGPTQGAGARGQGAWGPPGTDTTPPAGPTALRGCGNAPKTAFRWYREPPLNHARG